MTTPLAPVLCVLAAAALPVRAGAQGCDLSQGNATLGLSGLPQIGGNVRLGLTGRPLQPFLIMGDTGAGPLDLPFGRVCLDLGPGSFPLGGLQSPFNVLPRTGRYDHLLTIPEDPALRGAPFHFQGFVADDTAPNGFLAISNSQSMVVDGPDQVTTLFYETFDNGLNGWRIFGGIWQVGSPGAGPGAPYAGTGCAATVLGGHYPEWSNARLRSTPIDLPQVQPGEQIRVNFREWHSYNAGDSGRVEVYRFSDATWTEPPCASRSTGPGNAWSQKSVDLTSYAGERVFLSFVHAADGAWNSSGWHVDEVHVFRARPFVAIPEDFEDGLDHFWGASNGLWQVGTPGAGPGSACGGQRCAGTVLSGDYPAWGQSRLESGPLSLPQASFICLDFCEWHSLNAGDYAVVQVGTIDANGDCQWIEVGPRITGPGAVWSVTARDLTQFAGQTVRLGFLLSADGAWSSSGLYVDDVNLQVF